MSKDEPTDKLSKEEARALIRSIEELEKEEATAGEDRNQAA